MKKVRQLALIDMTALCDLLELEVKRQKTCKRKITGEFFVLSSSMCFRSHAVNSAHTILLSVRELFVRCPSRRTGGERSEDQTQHSDPSVPPNGNFYIELINELFIFHLNRSLYCSFTLLCLMCVVVFSSVVASVFSGEERS